MYKTKLNEAVKAFEEEMEQLKLDLYSLKRRAFVPKQDIPFGTVLTQEMFEILKLNWIFHRGLLDESDIGKINTVFLPSGIPVFKMSVADEKLENDL